MGPRKARFYALQNGENVIITKKVYKKDAKLYKNVRKIRIQTREKDDREFVNDAAQMNIFQKGRKCCNRSATWVWLTKVTTVARVKS